MSRFLSKIKKFIHVSLIVVILFTSLSLEMPAYSQTAAALPLNNPVQAPVATRTVKPISPLKFETNQGQFEASTSFKAQGQGYSLRLGATFSEFEFYLPSTAPIAMPAKGRPTPPRQSLRPKMELVGANQGARLSGSQELPSTNGYILGATAKDWVLKPVTYAEVQYAEVYANIDLRYYSSQAQQLEYDFVVKPNADPDLIGWQLSGVERTQIDASGNLVLGIGDAQFQHSKPVVYQERSGVKQLVEASYKLRGANAKGC